MSRKTCPPFKVAYSAVMLYGIHHKHENGAMNLEYPFNVPQGALYGKDQRGYWVLTDKSISATMGLFRFSLVDCKWYYSRENLTETVRRILEKCDSNPELLNIPVIRKMREVVLHCDYTQDMLFATTRANDIVVNKKLKSVKAGSKWAAEQRNKVSEKIQINPAEKLYSRLDEEMHTAGESYQLFWNRTAKRL